MYVKGGNEANNLQTHMTGDEEVIVGHSRALRIPGIRARRSGDFRVSGNSVEFRLIASNIETSYSLTFTAVVRREWSYPDLALPDYRPDRPALPPGTILRRTAC